MKIGTILVLILLLLLFASSELLPQCSEWIALTLMIFAGIPHGAFDLQVAEKRWRLDRSARTITFWVYSVCVFLMSSLCVYLPAVGLTFFLLISVIHFAEGEAHATSPSSPMWGWIIGIGAIVLPIGLHPTEARTYLSYFVSGDAFTTIEIPLLYLSHSIVIMLAFLLLGALNRRRRSDRTETIQRIMCLCGWILLPPLSGFSLWFVGRHSRQHLESCRSLLGSSGSTVPRDCVIISLLAIIGLTPFSVYFNFSKLEEIFAASICLIAGLTLPHMLVSHRMRDSLQKIPS